MKSQRTQEKTVLSGGYVAAAFRVRPFARGRLGKGKKTEQRRVRFYFEAMHYNQANASALRFAVDFVA